ncbi:uncharacterized protein LOC113229319 [Hyposmocoma kahamanoa]|uniref:uncharacterized protein LOC113229319 n=1 Tax=Hyposmocoma kahamanoa TaxID=1477025 RepID=UPI000E6D64F8|nr:uncharacterized protein LOC113229319 [Hyposmocoma kahamanoa]
MARRVRAAAGRSAAASAVPRTAPPPLHRVPREQRQVPRAESAARCASAVPYRSLLVLFAALSVRVSALCPDCLSDSHIVYLCGVCSTLAWTSKEGVPLASRNLPASFFNAAAAAGLASCAVDLYDYDPWHQHYGGYGHAHRHAAEYHNMAAAAHHNMAAAGYGGLLLSRGVPQYKPVEWGQHAQLDAAHAHHAPHAPHPAACAPYSYPPVPGLEAQVQDTSKDLYWF